ncbi:MAG: carboxypeptidase regulatory-like domain-containing protein, partial [Rhodothermales bacterium]
MRPLQYLYLCLLLVALPVFSAEAQQTATVTGTVTDATEGFRLGGANLVLLDAQAEEMITGAATGADGNYRITGIAPGDYVLAFRFVGYREERVPLTLSAGESRTVNIALTATGLDLNTVVVTASRQEEKVLDAPASISVLDAREIAANVVLSSAAVLRNTTGLDLAQTGIDRYEIVLRGFNNAFSGAAYVLTDYRQGSIASLGVNAYSMMPITQIDLERVEVVRGPGSALYGAGVDNGVIHFLTKDPFTYPGTSISLGGGERSMLLGSVRHAGVINDRVGYKLVGNFSRADDWEFDPADAQDRIQLESFRDEKLPVDYDNNKYNLNGTLAYKFRPNVTLTANGGFASAKSIFLSGIGTLQSEGFGYTYGQLRLQAGNFFAQAYINRNDAGDSFVYRDTAVEEVVDNSTLINTQAQYDFDLAADRLRVIVGADYEVTTPSTDGTIN